MNNDIYKKIINFHNLLLEDKNHRYKSWEHCYSFFMRDDLVKNIDNACLHLSFYLASWGMYRGSSFLLWKDYQIHISVVKKLLENKELQRLDFLSIGDVELDRIVELSKWIKQWYRDNVKNVNGKRKIVNVTDTLVTKIILGTLGCVPAYDRYFIEGMRKSGIKYSKFSRLNLKAIAKYYNDHEAEFEKAQQAIYKKNKILYPAMKLVDMYFWEIGFQADKKKTI